jgi:phospholipid/cholesterol/gamma-HCH transport system permease protein
MMDAKGDPALDDLPVQQDYAAQVRLQERQQELPRIQRRVGADGISRIRLSGAWVLRSLLPLAPRLRRQLLAHARETRAQWDMREVDTLDAAGALFLWRCWGRRRPALQLRPEHEAAFENLSATPIPLPMRAPADLLRPLEALGSRVFSLGVQIAQVVLLAGQLLLDLIALVRNPARIPWREISANIHRTGGQALPIVALVGFLVGVVLSYLSARQLQAYGANIYIINILGVGIVRELGPMLAAILVAGRSGSSMTAQLGVMRVTEELDALSVMGISQTQRLVLPKVIALSITLPLLVLWCNAIALVGGMLAASYELGIGFRQFLHTLPATVPIDNLWLGVGKGVLFGALIALIACHYGLRIRPNTESLGAGTTDSVVTSITVVILADAAIAVLFSSVGV